MRRVVSVGALFGGIYLGAIVLFGALLLVEPIFGPLSSSAYAADLAVGIAGALFVVDARAALQSRLCPLSPRRQAVRGLIYDDRLGSLVGWIWGFDVGLGVTTFRVTTGIWLLITLVLLGLVPAWAVFVFTTAFALSLLVVTLLPGARGASADERVEGSLRRIVWLSEHRRWVQVAYLCVAPLAIASVLDVI